jgi:hypothetical protein
MNHQFYPSEIGKALRNYAFEGPCGSLRVTLEGPSEGQDPGQGRIVGPDYGPVGRVRARSKNTT